MARKAKCTWMGEPDGTQPLSSEIDGRKLVTWRKSTAVAWQRSAAGSGAAGHCADEAEGQAETATSEAKAKRTAAARIVCDRTTKRAGAATLAERAIDDC
jgi:hypothetical protein